MSATSNPVACFLDAMRGAGIETDYMPKGDGTMERFHVSGEKSGSKNGWCVLHLDGVPAGSFGSWKDGTTSTTWCAMPDKSMTPSERTEHRERIESMRKAREAEQANVREEAANASVRIMVTAAPVKADHPYIVAKGIKPFGAKQLKDSLVIPVRIAGKLTSVQFIFQDGGGQFQKRFKTGGEKTGGCCVIGEVKGAMALLICEGWATGCTLHQATGHPVAIAFDAGNLIHVAQAARAKLPDLTIIICADDDHLTDGNPGIAKATEAARSVGGLLAIPDFGADRPEKATDFNDMAAWCGLEAVGSAITAALEAGKAVAPSENVGTSTGEPDGMGGTETPKQGVDCAMMESGVIGVSGVQPNNDGLSDITQEENHSVIGVTPEPITPDESKRPCFKVFDDWTPLPDGGKLKPGVWFFTAKPGKDGAPSALIQQWICSPLHLEAVTADGQDNNFGRLLRFRNTHGKWREWAMPMELLRGAGDELRGELLAMGAEIDSQAGRSLLAQYLQSKPPKRRIHCATQVGWCGESFVLPDTVIGAAASGVVFQSGERGHDEFTKAGNMAGWQAEISARAVGNPLLVLALSASFTGAMLSRCNGESGGIHFVGDSSTGKTTLLEAGCSAWGGAGYRRSWRATSNGMEGAASLFNDGLLALDEISECDPREVGTIIYALGNGRGKQRASRTGGARGVTRWRCFVLSSGERTISTAMAEGGAKAKAGQSVRLLDVPAARRFGAWDNLHDLPSGTAFSDAIKRASVTHHGHAGRAFLEKLTRDRRDFCAFLERFKALPTFSADGGEGQDKRAAARFALIALAGELATEYGITGWPEGDALKAAAEGFKAWRSLRGRGNDERRQILGQVEAFIERHGDSRFSNASASETADIVRINRAGWWRDDGGGRVYLFTSEGLREAVKGFDIKRALDILQEEGALPATGANGKRSIPMWIAGRTVRTYPICLEKLGGEHGA